MATIMKRGFGGCFKYFVSRYWGLIIWISFTSLIFWNTYSNFKTKPEYYYLRSILGGWLCISRGSAPVLTTCSILILLPICRSLHTTLHFIFAKLSSALLASWLSKVKIMHMVCAATLIIFSFIHTGAHIMNAVNFSKYYTESYPEINLAKYKGENPAFLICTWTGCSGIAMLILLTLMAATSTSKFRTNHFNTFYITHHLFVVYLILLFTHPLSGVLKVQSNVGQHIPGCKLLPNETNDPDVLVEHPVYCKVPPKFKCMPTQSWVWILIALIIYTSEICYRKYKENPMEAIQACHVIGKVVFLKIKCSENFIINPGQYVLIQFHRISKIEWHPFTVTKCPTPESQNFELLISVRGDWTKKLYNTINTPFIFDQKQSYISRLYHEPFKFLVDGPFSSPMQEMKNCKIVVCVAAGIGITSFVATLRELLMFEKENPKRLHLIWLSRDPSQFLWFGNHFWDLQNKFWENNEPDRFQIKLFVTRTNKKEETNTIFKNHKLRTRITTGRPNWKEEFRILNLMYNTSKVSLFCCGPKSLSKELRKRCLSANKQGCNYSFIKEGF